MFATVIVDTITEKPTYNSASCPNPCWDEIADHLPSCRFIIGRKKGCSVLIWLIDVISHCEQSSDKPLQAEESKWKGRNNSYPSKYHSLQKIIAEVLDDPSTAPTYQWQVWCGYIQRSCSIHYSSSHYTVQNIPHSNAFYLVASHN